MRLPGICRKQWLGQAIAPVRMPDGTERIMAADRVAVFNSEQGLGFDLAYKPGSLKEMLRQMASGDPEETYEPEPMRPEYLDREARIKVMDAQGVERAVLFPSAMALSVENYVKNVPAAYANIASFNRWFDEEWGFNRNGRLFARRCCRWPMWTWRCAETRAGAGGGREDRAAATGPAHGRSPGDPYFDPIWARLDEAGVTVVFHIMENWYNEHDGAGLGPGSVAGVVAHVGVAVDEQPVRRAADRGHPVGADLRQLFGRFPGLNVLVAEVRRSLGAAISSDTWTRAGGWGGTGRGSAGS